MKVYDRTIGGTLNHPIKTHVGRLADQRLAEKKSRIITWLTTLPQLEVRDAGSGNLYISLAAELEKLMHFPAGSLKLEDVTFSSYRKKTQLTRVSLNDKPWAIFKIFSDNALSHSVLRAFSEAEGCGFFPSIKDVVSPKLVAACRLVGKNFDPFSILVGETIVGGMPLLNWLELGAKKEGEARESFMAKASELANQCAMMIQKVHQAPLSTEVKAAPFSDIIMAEAVTLVDKIESALIGKEDAARVRRLLRQNYRFGHHASLARAHRDYTTNNILFSGAENSVGIVDLEKSGVEFPGKDLSKFTESLVIDGTNVGLREQEIDRLARVFEAAYLLNSPDYNFSNFWKMVRFYQVYTILSFINYDPGNKDRAAVLTARLNKLLRS